MTHVGTSQSQYIIKTHSRRDEADTMISFVGLFMPYCCVIAWRMMIGKIIRFVGFVWTSVNEEVSLIC